MSQSRQAHFQHAISAARVKVISLGVKVDHTFTKNIPAFTLIKLIDRYLTYVI